MHHGEEEASGEPKCGLPTPTRRLLQRQSQALHTGAQQMRDYRHELKEGSFSLGY